MAEVAAWADMTERDWQAEVVKLAQLLGWKKAYHTYDSRRSHSGFPDLVLVRDRVVFVELKSTSGKLSPAQAEWILALGKANAEVYVARPDDLDELVAVLRSAGPQADFWTRTFDEASGVAAKVAA